MGFVYDEDAGVVFFGVDEEFFEGLEGEFFFHL